MPQIDIKRRLGRLNLDDSYVDLDKKDYVDALNITHDSDVASQDIVTTNVKGNQAVNFSLPNGTNVTIGAKADTLRNRVFEFIWNSNGNHTILIYDRTTNTRSKLIENLTDTGGIDVLAFTQFGKIVHADIIYRDEEEGDLLFWTDGIVSPRKINVKHIQDADYSVIKTPFIELAKQPPRVPITAVYGSDANRDANSLRRKLLQATYRWKYDDFEKSTFTTYSKIPLPIGYYGSDNDTDSTKNNFITFTVETGDENVTDIEIAVRFSVSSDSSTTTFDDFILAVTLNKEQLNIPDNSTYDYLFYNDNIYPPLDVEEATQLFDWVPQKAKSQCAPNGNVIALGAITENYDNYPVSDLDVTITAENVTNSPPDADPPAVTYIQVANEFTFTVGGSSPVPTGTTYKIYIFFNGNPMIGQTFGPRLVCDYTSLVGDTTDDVATALFNDMNSFSSVPSIVTAGPTGNQWNANFGTAGSYVFSIQVVAGSGGGGSSISTEKVWLWRSNYLFGLAYKDDQGRLMPGVATFVNPTDSDNDFMVTTPSFSLDSGNVQTPVITADINHLPREDAVTYAWVRRRMTYQDFLFYMTCDFQSDSDFYYLCLANIEKYKTNNSQFIYGTAPITSESRLQVVAGITSDAYNGDIWTQDYEILGTVTKTLTGGSSPADDRLFVKIKIPASTPSPTYTTNMLVMVYTPMANPTDVADSVYWEWGEEYPIFTGYVITYSGLTGTFSVGETVTGGTSGATGIVVQDDGATTMTIKTLDGTFVAAETITGGTSGATATFVSIDAGTQYHGGKNQDQTANQPAEFVWDEGDVYFHERTMYDGGTTSSTSTDTVPIMDSNWSDFFASSVNDNGRGLTIQADARQTYFPATIRFGREYQQNTSINQTNRFIFENFQDLDRSFGDIFKMSIKDRYIRVGQRFKIGIVPIFNQISKDSSNSTLVASTDQLLNPVQYYVGDYGVGVEHPVWVDYNFSSYFFDTNRGVWCRLSLDGIVPVSQLYKINSWTTSHGVLRTGNYKIYGTFDPNSNNCIFAFEATGSDSAYTISFDEQTNAYESFLSYHPEMMCTLGNLLITWLNGTLWTHDSETYNNFYGVQYPSSITPVFNDQPPVKKKFLAIGYQSLNNVIWESPTNGDVATSTINPQTGFQQISNLKTVDYDLEETEVVAAFNYDANSNSDAVAGVNEGDYLGGNYIVTKLICPSAKSNVLVNISNPYITWIPSGRNF